MAKQSLLNIQKEALTSLGKIVDVKILDFGLKTTPQAFYFVNEYNKDPNNFDENKYFDFFASNFSLKEKV